MFHGYPHMYFYRNGESDLKLILQCMIVIPEHLKEEVSEKYMSFKPVNGGEARRLANTWLNEEALKYRNAPSVKDEVTKRVEIESKPPESRQVEFKKKINTSAPERKKSFLDGLLDDVDKKYRRGK